MTTTYAGMDAHAATIRVAVLTAEGGRPEEWQLTNEPRSVKRLAQRLKRTAPGPVVACYEAGPGGFALQRQLEAAGIECRVIAPALIPRRPGDRVKTDRRDARKLAELLRADLLTAVHPPTIDQEAVRDLCRAREDGVTDRTRARHRLAKPLLRRGIAYDGRNWTLRHRRWLLTLRFEHPAAQATFDDYLRALEGVEERLRTLEQELAACAASDDHREAVGLLRCFRGVDTVTAMTVLAELGDVTRFGSAPAVDVLPRAHAERVQQRCPSAAGTDHEDREQPRAPHPGGERVALPPPAAGGGSAAQAQGGPAVAGPWCWPTGRRPGSTAATGGWPLTASRWSWRTWPSPANSRVTCEAVLNIGARQQAAA